MFFFKNGLGFGCFFCLCISASPSTASTIASVASTTSTPAVLSASRWGFQQAVYHQPYGAFSIVEELYNMSITVIVDVVILLSSNNDADTLILSMIIKIWNLSIMIGKANSKHLTIHCLKRSILAIASVLCGAKDSANPLCRVHCPYKSLQSGRQYRHKSCLFPQPPSHKYPIRKPNYPRHYP